jgi:2-oxoglutarate ferredoxin oxidoreductase subunit gamma
MQNSVLMGGFGGQGVQTCGQLLTYGANEEGTIVTFYSQYGGAMRGGTSNCTVITSDEEIGSPTKAKPAYVIAFNIPSFKAFEKRVAPGGTMVVNSSLIKEDLYTRDDITYVGVPATTISEEIGSARVLNIVILGFFCELSKMVSPEVMKKVVLERMARKQEFIEMNTKAFDQGVEYAQKLKK